MSAAGLATFAEYRAQRARWAADALEDWDDTEVAHLAARLNQLMHDMHRALTARSEPVLRAARSAS